MLKIIRTGVCTLAAATTFMATSAQAETHTVLIMEGGYFPAIIYVHEGDSIVFTNNSESAHIMAGPDESWVSEPIPVDGTFTLALSDEIAETFSGLGDDGAVLEGAFSYEPAPL